MDDLISKDSQLINKSTKEHKLTTIKPKECGVSGCKIIPNVFMGPCRVSHNGRALDPFRDEILVNKLSDTSSMYRKTCNYKKRISLSVGLLWLIGFYLKHLPARCFPLASCQKMLPRTQPKPLIQLQNWDLHQFQRKKSISLLI